jgi:hypothetical protein
MFPEYVMFIKLFFTFFFINHGTDVIYSANISTVLPGFNGAVSRDRIWRYCVLLYLYQWTDLRLLPLLSRFFFLIFCSIEFFNVYVLGIAIFT